jgi:DNA polymerase III epsilon subunit family exonuclease
VEVEAIMGPDQLLRDTTFVAFDTETTGLTPVSAKIVEIGAVKFRGDGTDVGTFDELIDPEEQIPEEVQGIHGISDEMVKDKPTALEVLPLFIEFLGPAENVLLAHNALFDLGFIVLDLFRARMSLPEHRVFDTVTLAKILIPFLPGYRLQGLCAALDICKGQEHRALSDARLVKDLFLSLLGLAEGVTNVSELAVLTPPVGFAEAKVTRMDAPPGFEGLAAALEEGQSVEIIYAGGTKGPAPRRITPRAIVESDGILYLAAFCHVDGKNKMYRLSRIKRFTVEA